MARIDRARYHLDNFDGPSLDLNAPCLDDRCTWEHHHVFTDGELDDIARSIVGLFFGSHTDVVQSRALAAIHRRFRGAAPDTSVDGVRPDVGADLQPAADDR